MITYRGTEELLKKFKSYSQWYVGLSLTKPNMDGTNVTEPTAASYERQYLTGDITSSHNYMPTVTQTENGGKLVTDQTIYFAETYDNDKKMPEDWGEISYVCIFSAKTGGYLFAYQELPSPIHPGQDGQTTVALVRKGDLTIEIANPVSE